VTDQDRTTALNGAVAFHTAVDDLGLSLGVDATQTIAHDEQAVLNTAETFLAWLRGPASIHLLAGTVLDQSTGLPTGTPISVGGTVQIHDNEQFTLAIEFDDAKGFPTSDTDPATWTVADDSVASLTVSDDTLTCTVVAGAPGSTTVNVSVTLGDGTVLSANEAVDVLAAGAATITLTEGPVTVQA
jgi:hypothetical protein